MATYDIEEFDYNGVLDAKKDKVIQCLEENINECINYRDMNGNYSLKNIIPKYDQDGYIENFFAVFEEEEEIEEIKLMLNDEKKTIIENFSKTKVLQIVSCNKIIYNKKTYVIKDKIFSIEDKCTQLICELLK